MHKRVGVLDASTLPAEEAVAARRTTMSWAAEHSERTPVVCADVVVCATGRATGKRAHAVLDTRAGMLSVFKNTACTRVLATCYLSEVTKVTKVDYAAGSGGRVIEVHRSDRAAIRLSAGDEGTVHALFDALLSSCCNWSRERHTAPDCLQAEAGDCCVCLAPNTVNTKFEPCNHEVCCADCAARLDSCPICRAHIADVFAGAVYGRQGVVEKATLGSRGPGQVGGFAVARRRVSVPDGGWARVCEGAPIDEEVWASADKGPVGAGKGAPPQLSRADQGGARTAGKVVDTKGAGPGARLGLRPGLRVLPFGIHGVWVSSTHQTPRRPRPGARSAGLQGQQRGGHVQQSGGTHWPAPANGLAST